MKVLTSNKTSNRPFTTIISLQLKQNKTNSSTPKRKNVIKSKTNNKLAFWNYQSMFLVYLIFFWTHKTSFSSVQLLSHVRLFATPWIAAHQASLSITNSRSLLKLMSIESLMPSSHLILCRPLHLLPPIPPSIRVFSNESTLHMRWPKYWSFSFSIIPSIREQGWSISLLISVLDLCGVHSEQVPKLKIDADLTELFWEI